MCENQSPFSRPQPQTGRGNAGLGVTDRCSEVGESMQRSTWLQLQDLLGMGHAVALGSSTVYSSNPVLTVDSSLGPLVPEVTCAPLFLAIFVAQHKQLPLLPCL